MDWREKMAEDLLEAIKTKKECVSIEPLVRPFRCHLTLVRPFRC